MLFIVTDYCQGGDLFSYILEKNTILEAEMCIIMKQLLSALSYLSTQGICHRDIKLENIMMQNERDISRVKLIDFGLSKDLTEKNSK